MSAVFEPVTLGPLRLRNRVIRAAAFEGMSPAGTVSPALVDHHRAMALGGVALTTVAYASVTPGGRTFGHQLWMREAIVDGLRELTDAVHAEGGAASLQLGHGGYMADPRITKSPALAPSRVMNLYGLTLPKAMDAVAISEVVEAFAESTRLAARAGFDAVEIQAGHGYLVSQFLSPFTNVRRDDYGGDIDHRLRFAREIMRSVRTAAGSKVAVIVKMNLRDGFAGGLELDEAIEVARMFEREGADALVLSGGFSSRTPWYILRGDVPLQALVDGETRLLHKLGMKLFGRVVVEPFAFEEAYFFAMARQLREAVALPLALVGGIRSRATIDRVLDAGIDLVAMARPLIREPDFVRRLEREPAAQSRCEPCNLCVAAMYHSEQRCPRR
jgi:2,4-dienoyl-CoA reductase-like NADH-dependent reductase (Old Yellow Enzyme family)